MGSSIIKFRVGGTSYETTADTLQNADQQSFLREIMDPMFLRNESQRRPPRVRKLPDGNFVIDRDGPAFRHILNYLRYGGRLVLPENFNEVHILDAEAEFYGLNSLRRTLADR